MFIQIAQCKYLPTFKENGAAVGEKITIKKDRTLTPERILKILADVTEQPIQRPKDGKKSKKSYSGKKKTTTMKTEIVIEENGRIMSVSRSHRGRIHDFRAYPQTIKFKHIPSLTSIYS